MINKVKTSCGGVFVVSFIPIHHSTLYNSKVVKCNIISAETNFCKTGDIRYFLITAIISDSNIDHLPIRETVI